MRNQADAATAVESTAIEKAKALARALGATPAFRALEAAHEALHADQELRQSLAAFQARQQELQLSQAWGGADPEAVQALEREWEGLASRPTLAAQLAARDELVAQLREVVAEIGEGVGLDFGEACAPAGGCC